MLLRWSPLPLQGGGGGGEDSNNASIHDYQQVSETTHIPISLWNCLVIGPAAFGVGMAATASFAGISATVTREESAVAISVLYLSQNIGLIVGAAGGAGFSAVGYAKYLKRDLAGREGSEEVCPDFPAKGFPIAAIPWAWAQQTCLIELECRTLQESRVHDV